MVQLFNLKRQECSKNYKLHRKATVTNRSIFGECFLFDKKNNSLPIKAVIGSYLVWIKKGKYAAKLDMNLFAENQDSEEQITDINKLK